jgi:proline dehydrogenase
MSGTFVARLANRAARAYIAGPELDDAFRICGRLFGNGFNSTIGYWNGEEPQTAVARQYLLALATDALGEMNSFLSIKAPALGFDFALLRQVMREAQRCRTPVHFDSLGPETADPTLHAIGLLASEYAALGCTLPGRWHRSVCDCDVAVQLGLRVRVVKGQWPGNDGTDPDPAAGFFAVIERLAGRARHVGVATHDPCLARRSLACLARAGTPCELELLWGLPSAESIRIAAEAGVPVRFYVPYGSAWLPYALSQAVRHPRVLIWFARDLLVRPSAPKCVTHAGLKMRAALRPGGT